MEPRFNVKVFAADAPTLDKKAFVPIFHRLIQEKRLDELMIDVTDYGHVHDGPGVMLICHEAHYGMDEGGGRLGLRYERKRGGAGSVRERFEDALSRVLTACHILEEDASLKSKLRFRTDELLVGVNDRLVAPNTAATFAALRPDLEATLERLYAETHVTLDHLDAPKQPFAVKIKAANPPDVQSLLSRLRGT